MPVRQVAPGVWQWGTSGKRYRSKAAAERQARAIYASGYKQDVRSRAAAHRALSASRRAETAYVLDLQRIMGHVHEGVMRVVRREHPTFREAAMRHDDKDVGLGDELLRRMFRFVDSQVQLSFDFMAHLVNANSAKGAQLVGIRPRDDHRLAKVMDEARRKNVQLIRGASEDFLSQVRQTLRENEGNDAGSIADALQERVGVSQSRAVLIARDQTLKLNGQLTKHRQQSAGVERFKWSTSNDERVRPSHQDVNGQVFSWDDGADLDDEDEPTFPGQPINCRCVAIPIIAELETPAEAEAEEPEELEVAAE